MSEFLNLERESENNVERGDEENIAGDSEAELNIDLSINDAEETPKAAENSDGETVATDTAVRCPFDCGEAGLQSVEEHLRLCVQQPLACPFSEYGCGCDCVPRGALVDLLLQQGPRHSAILLQSMTNLGNELRRLETNFKTSNRNQEHIQELEDQVTDLKRENEELKSQQISQNTVINKLSEDLEAHNSLIDTASRRIDLCELKYEKKYYEYVWRVPNFKSLVNNAKVDASKREVSNVFFTSKNGYKIQMILYPNGLNEARGRYISLYYQIIKNKFDDLLSWPFKCNVELRLLDQDESNDQVFNVFYDPSDSQMMESYERPLGDDVRLYGSAMFVSKDVMNRVPSLRKNDTLFIRFSAKPVNLND